MEKLLLNLFESAKKDKKKFNTLKKLAIDCQLFQLSAELRDIERDLFPESEEYKQARLTANELDVVFRMINLTVNDSVKWLISETLKIHKKKRGKFSLSDAAILLAKKNAIFNDD